MTWIPVTDSERKEMLRTIGVDSVEALFAPVPEALRMRGWDMPAGLSEMALRAHMDGLASRNQPGLTCFLGGGYYDHFIPAAIDALSGRSEFYTAYTPYQPECAQGTLQSIYEYQSAVCRLSGMECANASLYDGGTAMFEAATMACRATRRTKVVVDGSVNPVWRGMLRTHSAKLDLDIVEGADPAGAACVIVQNPSFHGTVRDFAELGARCRAAGALFIVIFNPVSLGLLKTPGEMGADIAVAEGQSLGLPLGFGGPYLGILAARKEHIRKMPGRIVGETVDSAGRRGFVLTLQAREQHIRREKANSNICSNQALCALRALMYLCLMGPEGLRQTAGACHAKAEYLKSRMAAFVPVLNDGPTFHEFAVRLPRPAESVCAELLGRGFLAGLPLEAVGAGGPNDLLVAVTEKRTRAELDAYADAMKEVCCGTNL